jgi:arabinofuranosyltransferase
MRPRTPASRLLLAVLVASGVVLAFNIRGYYPFIADDALISLRYSSRLLAGHGLTWTAGQPVEGYSNLLWVLAVAALGVGGLDLVLAARVLGIASVLVSLWALLTVAVRPGRPGVDWWAASAGALFVALSAPIAVWAIAGLEQPLVGALLATSVPLMYGVLNAGTPEGVRRRRLLALSGILGLLTISRLDGPLFTAAAALTYVLGGPSALRTRLRELPRLLALPALCYGGQAVFRYLYYGEFVPNTALVKLTPTPVRRADGLAYLWAGVRSLSPFSFIAIAAMVGLLAVPTRRGRALYLLTISVLWSGYVVIIGGDIFPAYRHLVPLIVVLAFALVEFFQAVGDVLSKWRWVLATAAALTLVQFLPFAERGRADKQSHRAVTERWEWQCKDLGELLKTAFSAEEPLLAVTAAGCLPYWSELPSLDMLGLNDYYLPRHPPPNFGTGFLGHELGDGAYVLRRKPDLIVFSVGSGPSFRSGVQMDGMAEFHERYVPVPIRVAGMDPSPEVFFDRYSPKVGIVRTPSAVSVPGYLLRSDRTLARLNQAGRLVTAIVRGEPATVTFTANVDETWGVRVDGPHPEGVVARLQRTGTLVTIVVSTNALNPVEIDAVRLTAPTPES